MHPQSNDRAGRRHELARPDLGGSEKSTSGPERATKADRELKPGQVVTWAEVAESRRRSPPKFRSHGQGTLFPRNRSPDRQRSLERRRRLAASGPMPPQLAAKFTTGQLSVLRIVGDEVRARGRCTLFLDEVAARAGVCRRLAQAALRRAEGLGLLRIVERRLTAIVNDSNLVTIVSPEWLAWLRLKARSSFLSAKNFRARTISDSKHESRRGEGPKKEFGGVGIARSVPRSPP